MDENQPHRLRYALKQCEKSYRDACDNPRYWEQALGNSEGLLAQLPNLPADERAVWDARLDAWLPAIRDGARRVVGERVLRRIRDSLTSAAERLADDADPSRELDWLVSELGDPSTVACLDSADLNDATDCLAALQAELARTTVAHQLAQTADRLAHVETRLAELEASMAAPDAVVDRHLARVIAGDLDRAQAEVDRLDDLPDVSGLLDLSDIPDLPSLTNPESAREQPGAVRQRLAARLRQLRARYDAL